MISRLFAGARDTDDVVVVVEHVFWFFDEVGIEYMLIEGACRVKGLGTGDDVDFGGFFRPDSKVDM